MQARTEHKVVGEHKLKVMLVRKEESSESGGIAQGNAGQCKVQLELGEAGWLKARKWWPGQGRSEGQMKSAEYKCKSKEKWQAG